MKTIRWNEYGVLAFRLFLAFIFYTLARILFIIFNLDSFNDIQFHAFFNLLKHGILFDTSAIIYINLVFVIMSIIPLKINTSLFYQKILFIVYFITNTIAYATNFIDMAYYPFSKTRLTSASMEIIKNEQNKGTFLLLFLKDYWHLLIIFILCIGIWILLYQRISIKTQNNTIKNTPYFIGSIIVFILIGTLSLAGIRGGDLSTATRPINILDANRYVNTSAQADAILNTPFTIIRTIGKNKGFKELHLVNQEDINNILPIKNYQKSVETKPNIVIFILESFAREYWGVMNKDRGIKNFKSYTPFLDSLAQHAFVWNNAFANGRQSIHGMSSVLAGIPSFSVAYTSSPYVKQPTQSIVSICNEMGYDTSFFHSAPNGSMGFLGFSNILGFNHYYGKTEYNNDADFDGVWGIWDEPFFSYVSDVLSSKKQPFMGTIFSVSSHHPFQIPKKYEGKFDKGTIAIHQCISYSDYSLKQFFEKAKKESWFENTIFVFTADHTNMSYYPYYQQAITSTAIPILFYSPNTKFFEQGKISDDIAQQIDIYPTLSHLIGYNKPIRSWGRSLFSNHTPRAYISNAQLYLLMQGDYIYSLTLDGKPHGIFKKDDLSLKNNLLHENKTLEMQQGIKDLQAFSQDYIHRIIHKKLSPP